MLIALARLRWIIRCLIVFGISVAGLILTLEIWANPSLVMSMPGSSALVALQDHGQFEICGCSPSWFIPIATILIDWLLWPGRWSATRRSRKSTPKIDQILAEAPFEIYVSPVGSYSDRRGFHAPNILARILNDAEFDLSHLRPPTTLPTDDAPAAPAADVAPVYDHTQPMIRSSGPIGYRPTLAYVHGTNEPDPGLVASAAINMEPPPSAAYSDAGTTPELALTSWNAFGNIPATQPDTYLDHIPGQLPADQLIQT